MIVQYSIIWGKNIGWFFWESWTSHNFYIETNGNLIFDLRIFTLRTVFMKGNAFGNRGICVFLECCYNGRKISDSLSYVTVRGGRKGGKVKGEERRLVHSLPPCTWTDWPSTCVFVTVNEALRYLTKSIPNLCQWYSLALLTGYFLETK
jgi:hypothetical protein